MRISTRWARSPRQLNLASSDKLECSEEHRQEKLPHCIFRSFILDLILHFLALDHGTITTRNMYNRDSAPTSICPRNNNVTP